MVLFDHLPSPALHLDKDARIVGVNTLGLSLFGWQTLPSSPPRFHDYLDQSIAEDFNEFYRQVTSEQLLSFNTNIHLEDVRELPVTIKASATPDGGRIFLINRHDIYSSGCGEKCLNAALLEAQYEHNPGGILLVNDQMEMVSFNKEFVIGLLASSGGSSAKAVAKKLCQNVLENISVSDNRFQVSVSIGVAMYPDHGAEPDLLIRNADMAMYQAKRLSKNRCTLYKPDLAN